MLVDIGCPSDFDNLALHKGTHFSLREQRLLVRSCALNIEDKEASVEGNKDDDTPKIVGGVIGGVIFVIILFLVAYFIRKRSKNFTAASRPPKNEVR